MTPCQTADGPLLTTREAARRLGLSRYTLWRAVRRGHLAPAARTAGGFYRFHPADVAAYGRARAGYNAGERGGTARRDVRATSAVCFHTTFEQAAVGLAHVSLDGHWLRVNQALCAMLGYTPDDLLQHPVQEITHPDDRAAACDQAGRLLAGAAQTAMREYRYLRKDGSVAWVSWTGSLVRTATGAPDYVIAVIADCSARKSLEEAARIEADRFRALTEHASDLVSILDAQGRVIYSSGSHERILGTAPGEDMGSSAFDVIHPDDHARVRSAIAASFATPGPTPPLIFRRRAADGTWRWLEAVGNNRLDDPAIRGLVVNSRDITERMRVEDALRRQALYDPLTDLPNRTLLRDRLDQALRGAERDHHSFALLLLDLDGFKDVNDTFGHEQGDVLLQQAGQRLRAAVRASDTVARLGGDEFAVLLPATDEAGAVAVACALRAALASPLRIAGYAVAVGASIGLALYPAHGSDAATLLRHADTAMYMAKRAGGEYALYDAARDPHSPQRLALLGELRQAIAAGGLVLHYQPKVALASGQVCGVEALVRWPHPEHGLIPPDRFIALAEQHRLIGPLTLWVLEEVLRQGQDWARAGWDLNIAVNLSPWSLHDPTLPETIAALLRRYDTPAERLCLELTESSVMADAEHALAVLTRLAALGVALSVDDFGTGYSSLAYLKRLPVNEVKIDRTFVAHVATDEADTAVVRATVGLGHSLGLRVVAEGVEDRATWDALAALGCDVAQGYSIARPLPPVALAQWLAAPGTPRRAPDAERTA